MKFEKYHICEEIKENLRDLGFKKPTDIQYKTIPSIMNGEDVLAIAQTGTGKTAAFAIPLIDRINKTKSSKRTSGIKTIILVPTRELALQIGDVFNKFSKNTNVKTFALHGGVEQERQIKKLQDGIDVLVTTPGRMFDLINQGYINLEYIETLVLDEADYMLTLGFIEDIKYVKKMLKRRHQTLFFSATIDKEIKKLASSQVKADALRIQISPKNPVAKRVEHSVMFVEMDDKRHFLKRFIDEHADKKIIVFVRTKVRVERVLAFLHKNDVDAESLHSDRDQKERIEILERFKGKSGGVLVATDVSARGIDIPNVHYVINYDLPIKVENYVHRVGRTGRAFNNGEAISFCSKGEKELLEQIEEFIGKTIDKVNVGKNQYKRVVAEEKSGPSYLDALAELEAFEANAPKKKKKKKK